MQVVAITGGAGFVGRRLAAALLDDPGLGIREVRLLDVRAPEPIPFAASSTRTRHKIGTEQLRFVQCDLREADQVSAALAGVDTVFHLASYGMSGREMLNVPMIRAVNLGGTKHILAACRSLSIPRLIYVSTYNTVFNTAPILSGSEDRVPYCPLHLFHDEYSRTKRQAEEMCLAANAPAEGLATCAIRPAAIFGDGEERHLPRILGTVRAGLGLAAIGSEDTLCDWVYVDNLTHALILAGQSLAAGSASRAAGQAYCISDDTPLNNFLFLRPLLHGLGYTNVFRFWVPTVIMFYVAWFLEMVRLVLVWVSPRLMFQPFLTRAEVSKVGVTHWFSMEKARTQLGYTPIVAPEEAIKRCIEYYTDEFGTSEVRKARAAMHPTSPAASSLSAAASKKDR